jgi:hypothetical protein
MLHHISIKHTAGNRNIGHIVRLPPIRHCLLNKSPSLRIIPIHPTHILLTTLHPPLDPALQHHTPDLVFLNALISEVVGEPAGTPRTTTGGRAAIEGDFFDASAAAEQVEGWEGMVQRLGGEVERAAYRAALWFGVVCQ